MDKFMLFAGAHYYPAGGWDDLIGTYNTLAEAKQALRDLNSRDRDWWHIATIEDGIVEECE